MNCQEIGNREKTPKWVSDKGSWQIETNVQAPTRNIVYFFNKNGELIYRENVDGVVLDLKKKRVKMRLKKALENALVAWHKDHRYRDDQQLISMLFRN